jgi:hypothetical protein
MPEALADGFVLSFALTNHSESTKPITEYSGLPHQLVYLHDACFDQTPIWRSCGRLAAEFNVSLMNVVATIGATRRGGVRSPDIQHNPTWS